VKKVLEIILSIPKKVFFVTISKIAKTANIGHLETQEKMLKISLSEESLNGAMKESFLIIHILPVLQFFVGLVMMCGIAKCVITASIVLAVLVSSIKNIVFSIKNIRVKNMKHSFQKS